MALPDTGFVAANLFADSNNIDWDGDTFKCALYTSAWSPDLSSAIGYSATNEVSGTGYTAGGIALTSVVITRNTTGFKMAAADIVFTGATLTDVAAAAVYSDTATAPVSKPLVAVFKLSESGANNGGTFTLTLSGGAVINIPVA